VGKNEGFADNMKIGKSVGLIVGFIVERLGPLVGHNEVNIDGCKDGMLNVGALDGEIGLLDGNGVGLALTKLGVQVVGFEEGPVGDTVLLVGRTVVDFDGLLLFVGFCVGDLLGVRVGILVYSRVGKLLDGKLGLCVATLGLADDVQVVVVDVGYTVDERKLGNSVGVTVAEV